jgi:hypothetical protein
VSPLSLKWTTGTGPLFAGIRVSTAPAAGRSYGVFVAAAPRQFLDAREAVVPDLRQDESARSNLGVVNLGSGAADFRIDVFAGADGSLAGTGTLTVAPNGIAQINAILRDLAPGTARAWARVTPAVLHSGEFPWPFAAYAVINDGAVPGQGTDDGSFLPAIPE